MSLKKSHKSYPQTFKDEAVLMVLEQGYSIAEAAKSLGISTSLLYNWKGRCCPNQPANHDFPSPK
ncbi:hypothetical protein CF133_00815 [Aeromonas salmonicida]|nr:hypothetical protein CF133_00815 [Aeromonas salmonicida]